MSLLFLFHILFNLFVLSALIFWTGILMRGKAKKDAKVPDPIAPFGAKIVFFLESTNNFENFMKKN